MSLCGAALGFVGVTILIGPSALEQSGMFGYALALAGAMLWALYSNLRRLDTDDALVSLTLICGVSAFVCATVTVAQGVSELPTQAQWITITLLALGPAGGAFFLWDAGMKTGNAPLLSVLGYAAPVISSALVVAFGYADPSWVIVASTGLIAAGGLLAGRV